MRRRTLVIVVVAALAFTGGLYAGFATLPSRGAAGGSAAASAAAASAGASDAIVAARPSTAGSSLDPSPSSQAASPRPSSSAGSPTVLPSPSPAPSPTPTLTAEPTPVPPLAEGIVPILYYHRVEEPPAGFADWSLASRRSFLRTNVLPIAFDAQLSWLAEHGYTTILPRDLAAHWDKGKKLPPRPIILTFDDGTPDWITTVLPLLRKHHMVAEFYVAIGHIGSELSWDDLRALLDAGNGIGGHDINHTQLAGFADGHTLGAERMWNEVKGARDIIGANLGVKPDSMAYVGGGYNATLVDLVRRAGYTTARAIVRGVVQTPGLRFQLRVARIGAYDDVTDVRDPSMVPGLPTFEKRVTGVDPG